ncbi:MAG: dehydrogenase, partial [Chloroflexi bacterium CG07_land_8_20_14_0_80_51_10]
MTETKIVKTICGMCGIDCGLNVYVEDGRIVKVEGMPEHVINQLCVKAEGMLELVYSPERITHPMR